jgi:hypothetical protein
MRGLCALFLLLTPACAKDFLGVQQLAGFSRDQGATLLLYFNNENLLWLLRQGRSR